MDRALHWENVYRTRRANEVYDQQNPWDRGLQFPSNSRSQRWMW